MLLTKKKAITIAIILSVFGLIMAIGVAKHSGSDKKEKKKAMRTELMLSASDVVNVESGSLSSLIGFTGDLSPSQQTLIASEVDAKVNQVLVDEGQMVKKGQILAKLDTDDLSQDVMQQQANTTSAKASLELNKQKLEKQQELFDEGFISKISFDELKTNYQASLQNYKAQQAMLSRSKEQLVRATVRAPYDGLVYQKDIQVGQLALKNTKLFTIASLASLEIKAPIPATQIDLVKIGQSVNFSVENTDDVFIGKVNRINQVAQDSTRSYMVYVLVDNSKAKLKGGQFIKGEIILYKLDNQLIIPCDAIRKVETAPQILKIKDNTVVPIDVKIALQNTLNNKCAIVGDVSMADKIISANAFSVKAGDKVAIN